MPNVECRICKETFFVKPYFIQRGWGKFCSRTCQFVSQKKGKMVDCFICARKVYKAPRHLEHSKSKKYFCSKSCQTVWRNSIVYVGRDHPNWTNGESSYRDIMLRNVEAMICRRCKINDKRVLVVHHLDKNRQNNNPENLIWLCCNCHFLIHRHKNEIKKFMEALV